VVGTEAHTQITLPHEDTGWSLAGLLPEISPPEEGGRVEIRGVGTFEFAPTEIRRTRPDLFREGHFSVFDAVVHVVEREGIELTYRYDETAATHLILALNGLQGWWYDAHYSGGRFERTAVRMDHFPVQEGMRVRLYLEQPERHAAIHESFRDEVNRRDATGGGVVIPEVVIRGARATTVMREVAVEPY